MVETLAVLYTLTATLVAWSVPSPASAAQNNASPLAITQSNGYQDLFFIPIAAGIFVISWLLTRHGVPETKVSGLMVAILSFVWWNARVDSRTSQVVLWTYVLRSFLKARQYRN